MPQFDFIHLDTEADTRGDTQAAVPGHERLFEDAAFEELRSIERRRVLQIIRAVEQ